MYRLGELYRIEGYHKLESRSAWTGARSMLKGRQKAWDKISGNQAEIQTSDLQLQVSNFTSTHSCSVILYR
jgi:hypothetical protein